MNPTELDASRQILEKAKTLGVTGAGVNALGSVASPISVTSLSTAERPLTIPKTNQSTIGTEIIAGAESEAQRLAKAEEQAKADFKPVTQAQTLRERTLSSISSLFGDKKEALADATAADATIDPFRKDLTDINTKIADTTVQYRGVQDEIKGRGDITQEAQQGLLFNAEQKYGRVLADLAIRQSAANQNISQMEASMDRKLQLELAPIESDIQFLKDFELENADILKEDEKELLNFVVNAREKEKARITEEQGIANTAINAALQNGIRIPSDVMQQILSKPSQTYSILAANGISLQDPLDRQIKQAQLGNLQAEAQKKRAEALALGGFQTADGKVALPRDEALKINKELTGTDAYKVVRKGQDSLQFLTDFETLFNETGGTSAVFSPRQNAELKAKYNATILNLKEFFNLGVLNGPDEAILKSIVPDPTNRSAALTLGTLGIYKPSAGTEAGIANMKKQIEDTLDDRYASISAQYSAYSPESVTSLNDLNRIYIQNKMLVNPEVKALITENPDLSIDEIVSIINTKL